MKNRDISPEVFIEFIIENAFKKVPELVEMIPVDEMYERLRKNIKNVYETREDDVNYSALYYPGSKQIYIVNRKKKFDKTLLKRFKMEFTHEAIHALFTKGTKVGLDKKDEELSVKKNIKGFFNGDRKFKYRGNLIQRCLFLIKAFRYLNKRSGIGLNEGFTEWLNSKIWGRTFIYDNLVSILEQIEAVWGMRKTLIIGNGDVDEISKLLGIDKKTFDEFNYRMDEIYRVDDRYLDFEIVRDKYLRNEKAPFDYFMLDLDPNETDLESKREQVERMEQFFWEIRSENLIKIEELLLDNLILKNIEPFLEVENISVIQMSSIMNILEKVDKIVYSIDVDTAELEHSDAYKRFGEMISIIRNKFINSYKNKIEGVSLEEVKQISDYYYKSMSHFDSSRDEEFERQLRIRNQKYYTEMLLPEVKKYVKKSDSINLNRLYDYTVMIMECEVSTKEIWQCLFHKLLSEDEISFIISELNLYISYGMKITSENIKKVEGEEDTYCIIVGDEEVGSVTYGEIKGILEGKSYFRNSKFYFNANYEKAPEVECIVDLVEELSNSESTEVSAQESADCTR